MKNYLFFILTLLFFSCETEQNPITNESNQNHEENEQSSGGENSPDIENIKEFSVIISNPEKERDYSYHNQGNLGIFENPDSETSFSGKVRLEYFTDNNKVNPSEINIKWSSNIDGVISRENLSEEYTSNFGKSLSKGNHTIYFEATLDSDSSFVAKDSVKISNVISMKLEPTDRSVKINWSKYNGDNFKSYLIYKENFEPIAEIENINKLTYEDKTVTLAQKSNYQIVVKTSYSINNITSGSNIEEEKAGKYIKINHYITKAIYDEDRNKIYAIVGEKSRFFDYADEYGLIILDNDSKITEINSHILKDSRFADLDMSPDGKYLFLCERGVDKITRLNLNSMETNSFDVAYGGWGVHKIEVGNNYRLYCARTPPTSGSSQLYILDGLSGEFINDYGWLIHGDIEFNIHNNKLYHGTSIREKWVIKFSVENDELIREKIFSPDIGWPKGFILISKNGNSIFWEKYQLDRNLNIIREFEIPIVASNLDKSLISDGGKLLNFDNLNTIFEYPNFPSNELSNEIFLADDSILIIKSNQPYTNERFTYLFKINTN